MTGFHLLEDVVVNPEVGHLGVGGYQVHYVAKLDSIRLALHRAVTTNQHQDAASTGLGVERLGCELHLWEVVEGLLDGLLALSDLALKLEVGGLLVERAEARAVGAEGLVVVLAERRADLLGLGARGQQSV